MESENGIFKKHEQTNILEPKIILNYNEIMKSIPKNAKCNSEEELKNTYIEWRWRFFNINGRKLIEISKKEPNKEREYINNNGQWVKYTLDKFWEKYITDIKYHYVKE